MKVISILFLQASSLWALLMGKNKMHLWNKVPQNNVKVMNTDIIWKFVTPKLCVSNMDTVPSTNKKLQP